METLTFREVHKDLDNEIILLEKDHNVKSFKEKGDFLNNIGFQNSISAKLYSAIADNVDIVRDYKIKYPLCKFILEPQLERLCEKYNLYVRGLKYYMGDIPEINIKHLMNFSIKFHDLHDDFKKMTLDLIERHFGYQNLGVKVNNYVLNLFYRLLGVIVIGKEPQFYRSLNILQLQDVSLDLNDIQSLYELSNSHIKKVQNILI